MTSQIAYARSQIADAITATQAARRLDPSLDADLGQVETGLTDVLGRLDGQLDEADRSTGDSLYNDIASADAPPWEAALTAVVVILVHVRSATGDLFGDEETPPATGLDGADELRQALSNVESALESARTSLRQRAPQN